ncbi:DNA replication regulator Sld3 [Purpureocillium lavendulum]|uniref:DNA replication regulator Sld3 n=1 Tax=Purpureocillium lavendulum TaxID=1247861 RepID=A0AB34G4N7_9HYPO|nr:DNA replication regulator Sld3 [Purpureocillium lavendulum]
MSSLLRRDGDQHGSSSISSPIGQPRRTESAAMDHLLKPSIAVKPHPHNLHVQPRSLLPLMVLPRKHLPLACLDLTPSDNGMPPSRFYECHVKILDLESRVGSTPSVLVARSDSRGAMYALERQDTGLYVVCKLGSWVDLDLLAAKATAISRERLWPARPMRREQDAPTAITTPQLHKDQRKKRAAIEAIQSLVRKRGRSQSVSTFEDVAVQDDVAAMSALPNQLPPPEVKVEQQEEPDLPTAHLAMDTPGDPERAPDAEPQNTAHNIFDNIRTQYFDALYRSMVGVLHFSYQCWRLTWVQGSLAYYAKGPLSRARSAFHLDLESSLDMADLIEFLKGMILTTVQIDKKYRETIPDVVTKMKDHVNSSDEGARRRRKPKKMRLGKNGLYPVEEESVCRWWASNKPELSDDQTGFSAAQIKSHVSLLRTRETQLQMILILEILALEPLRSNVDPGEDSLPALPGTDSTALLPSMAPPPPKKRNKHNLPVLLDVHADRLTIWQSTAFDDLLLLGDSQTSQVSADGQSQMSSSEPLKDFCVDVIVPFFSARLPELCDSINRKLGGPVIVSPPKSKSSTRSSKREQQKPGAAAKRPATLNNQRKTLQRALSTDQQHRRSVSRGPSNAIALMRSATSTAVPGVKREGSEPAALRSIPSGALNQPRQQQPSLLRSSSMTNLQDCKANKKAMVEAELKDAISALRKPNRGVVGKAMAEADERRAMTGFSAKKVKKVSRGPVGSTIVKATPANNRFRDALAVKGETIADCLHDRTEELIPPSSVGHLAPSTASSVGQRDAFIASTSPATELVGGTPIRPTAHASFIRRPPNEEPAIPPSSPLMERKANTVDAFLIPSSAIKTRERLDFMTPRRNNVAVTPIKRTAPRPEALSESPGFVEAHPQKTVSIYQRLGWDDDFDDL